MSRSPRRVLLAAGTVAVALLATVGVRFAANADTVSSPQTKAVTAAAVFAHPGVLLSRAQLDFVKGKVAAGAAPWAAANSQMMASRYASLSRRAGS